MPEPKLGSTGSAPIIKQGHTTTGQHGNDPHAKGAIKEPKPLKAN